MPEVEIIISLKPAELGWLKSVDYAIAFFERFVQAMKIEMQFELTAETVLGFFKTRADFKRLLLFLSEISIDTNSSYSPSEDFKIWEISIIKPGNTEGNTLLKEFAEKINDFFGHFGHVEFKENKIVLKMPTNFHLNTFFKNNDIAQKMMQFVKGAATR